VVDHKAIQEQLNARRGFPNKPCMFPNKPYMVLNNSRLAQTYWF